MTVIDGNKIADRNYPRVKIAAKNIERANREVENQANAIATANPRREISVTAGSTTSNQDFGYNMQASLLLVKRITAINPGQSDEIRFDRFVNDPNDANSDR